MPRRGLLSVWNAKKVSGKGTAKIPTEVALKLHAEAKRFEGEGYTQSAISRKLGVPKRTLSSWLSGRHKPHGQVNIINLTPRKTLARFFGCFEVAGWIGKYPSSQRENKTHYKLAINARDENKIKTVQEIIRKLTGKKYPYYLIEHETEDVPRHRLIFHNKFLVEFWNGYEGIPSHYERPEYTETRDKLPEKFLSGVLEVRAGFAFGRKHLLLGHTSTKTSKEIVKVLDKLDIDFWLGEEEPSLALRKNYPNCSPRLTITIHKQDDLEFIYNQIPVENETVKNSLERILEVRN